MLSKRAKRVQPSLTLALSAKMKHLKKEGRSIIDLGAGEPDFPTPEIVRKKAIQAIEKGYTKYTPAAGLPILREEVASWFSRRLGVPYKAEEIVISVGSKHSLFNIMMALLDEGDEVLLPVPFWLTYPEQIGLAGGTTILLPSSREKKFKISAQDVQKHLSPKTKALILNTPSNPTGMVYSSHELESIFKVVEENHLYLILDEIYSQMVYDPCQYISPISLAPHLKEKVILVNGVSKAYSMTGWRIGFLAAPQAIAHSIANIQSHTTSNPCSISQYAALAALQYAEKDVETMVKEFQKRRDFVYQRLNQIQDVKVLKPDGAFYIFPSLELWVEEGKRFASTLQFTEELLETEGVGLIPGEVFGAPGYVRISFAASQKDLEEGISRLQNFLESNRP